ncbi:MAG: hypothetical protein BWX88_00660 [Planctomycetes bacterium ADurb.Bin126]|nr:MAG: hypothetical protein BWX88_00660 [Planctomycetes bacterium ADurb.Bin126]HOD81536.1 hypothetical protein [Phycisphaerae bacterium]HQL75041.1 hypothetical protein [Phycisphaerae bacterium]
MKHIPQERRIVERMVPGVLCLEGFLGSDPRSLSEIIETDRRALEDIGLDCQSVARRLEKVYEIAVANLERPVQVGTDLEAVHLSAMGRIPCPWGGCGLWPKGDVVLTDRTTGRVYRFTALSMHLIGLHGFFQGRGHRYRLEPDEIARLLGLGKEGSQ